MEQQPTPNDTSTFFWKREISFGQFASILLTIVTLFGTILWNLGKTQAEQGVRINAVEKSLAEIPGTLREITGELKENNKETQAKTELILIKLENKKDR